VPGHITQRKDTGRWRARYPKPNATKPTDQIEKTFRTKREAEAWLVAQQASVLTGSHIAPSEGERRFRDVYDVWRVTRWPGLEPKTTARYGQVWRTYLEPEFGGRKLNTITRELVRRYFATLVQDGKAPGTIRKVHAVLSAILSEAVELGYLKVNPAAGVRGLPRAPHREMLFLSAEEVRALAEGITPYYRVLIYMAAYTGLRASELTGLRWRNVDLLHGKLTVEEALKEIGGELHFGPPKNHERRTITLSKSLCTMLEERGVGAPDALVFPGPQGGPMRHSLFYRRHFRPAVTGYTDKDGVKHPGVLPAAKAGLRFHDLRHTCAALSIAQDAHPKLIQARLGHSSITITLDRYGHLFPSVEAALAEKLDAAFIAATTDNATNVVELHAEEQGS
jgi:integrase